MIRALVVDDFPARHDALVDMLEAAPGIVVAATAIGGDQALELALRLRPDVVTVAARRPLLDGIETVRRIMYACPIPTVIIDSGEEGELAVDAFLAREAGAIAVCRKPRGALDPLYPMLARRIVEMVRMASEIRVFQRWRRPEETNRDASPGAPVLAPFYPRVELVAIGASTGGPPALCEILSGLSKAFPVPILIVQHIAKGFLPGMVEWLSSTSGLSVEIAEDGTAVQPGRVYMAPDEHHMAISGSHTVRLLRGPPVNGMCPSVSILFRSVAAEIGRAAVGILLSGMGRDGADELLMMRNRGSLTIAQNKETAVINGMPGEAVKLGGASYVLPPNLIVELLNTRVCRRTP